MDGTIQYWHWLLRTLVKPYVDGFLLESEAEALTTNEGDLPLFNHPVDSTGANTQVGGDLLDCEEPLARNVTDRARCSHYLHGTPPQSGHPVNPPSTILEGIAVRPAILTTCTFIMAELNYEKWSPPLRFPESGRDRTRAAWRGMPRDP